MRTLGVVRQPGEYCTLRICALHQWSRTTAEGIIGSVTGRVESPSSLLLGRYDDSGRLRFFARTTPLNPAARRDLAGRLRAAGAEHPWHGRKFSIGWGRSSELDHQPVWPELVAEFHGDTAVDEGRYRHPVRFVRLREDVTAEHVPVFGALSCRRPPARGDS